MLGGHFIALPHSVVILCFPEEGGASICLLARYSCLNSALPFVEVGQATINK
jgi:hypothetical protein